MKVIVFGASGKVGQKIISNLLTDGHEVVAFVYGASPFESQHKLMVVQGDVKDYEAVHSAISGCKVVVSALGSWGTKTKDILSSGMANIVPAMQDLRVKKIISLTGADALLPNEKPNGIQRLTRPFFMLVAGKILKDGERHLKILAESDLDWTVVRSPIMNESGSTAFTLGDHSLRPWETVHREAVAIAMVRLVDSSEFIARAPTIRRT